MDESKFNKLLKVIILDESKFNKLLIHNESKFNKLLKVMKQIATPSAEDGTFVRSVEWIEKIATDCLTDLQTMNYDNNNNNNPTNPTK